MRLIVTETLALLIELSLAEVFLYPYDLSNNVCGSDSSIFLVPWVYRVSETQP